MKKKILSLALCIIMCLSVATAFAGCSGGSSSNGDSNSNPNGSGDAAASGDAFVIMTEQLDGLFNPFFYTSAPDGTIVGMTQIGMMGSKYENGVIEVAYGDDEAVVTKDFAFKENDNDTTTYTFVLKNGIKFSDGHPLTMEDVLFNYYVYLDPVYTGSNTLYSTDILGLSAYRTQIADDGNGDSDDLISANASNRAENRRNELISIFLSQKESAASGEVSYETMKAAIEAHSLSKGYIEAISNNASEVTNANLLADYDYALKLFKEELEKDYLAAQESYIDAPYDQYEEFKNEIFCFMFREGFVTPVYAKGEDGKDDRTKFESFEYSYDANVINTKEAAIERVYNQTTVKNLDQILTIWATASTLITEYEAKAKEVILHENASDSGLAIPNIKGIVSLGHTDAAGTTINVNGTDYKIASAHNEDGTVANADEYDVLQITINGIDPKAKWNFAITIAPQHYYGEGSSVPVDIKNNLFGVEYASFDFMADVIQSTRNVKLPMGAGAYKVTNVSNSDTPAQNEFFANNVVYFKKNDNFTTVGANIENAKIDKIRYQVVSSNNAIGALEAGNVHYISPALTDNNYNKLEALKDKGMVTLTSEQLGYGYIGINASKVPDVNLRKAIMCAMNTEQAISYYRANTAEQIYWPMSKVSWAYPKGDDANDNGKDYPAFGSWSDEIAKENVKKYMELAGVSAGDKALTLKFTIAGSSLQDHPTYKVFRDASELLNSLGWNVEVVCDTQALIKINTGSLAVWAAAWSSALDPDLYQVYHKDSTATSTAAWGYKHIKTSGTREEQAILDELSEYIDQARETYDEAERAALYKDAMSLILDLAVELPVYQRSVLYAYNSKVVKIPVTEINPYSSPLDKIWEVEFVK